MIPEELDTIVAPATPAGRSALAVVRIDGPRAEAIARELTRGATLEERVATRVSLFDDELIDDVILTLFKGPRSFTGNDLVEISLHGSPYLVTRCIRAIVRRGARHAEAGEFSERAVLSGKIDLVQAEAIAELIASRTATQARLALSHLDGELSRSAHAIRESLLDVISRLEAGLDFADEGYQFIEREEIGQRLDASLAAAAAIRASYARGRATLEGLTAVILGRPNAGKSTLMNFLCGSERAIVTPIPGTTRDLLREPIEIGGLPVTLIDTAGLRVTGDSVEQIGVGRAREAAQRADLVLYLIDAGEGETELDRAEIGSLPSVLVVYTKIDVAASPAGETGISVRLGSGVESLLAELDARVRETFVAPEGSATIVNERQLRAVEECHEALESARSLLPDAADEIVLVELYRAANALGLLTGAITHAEILEEIFSKFCIGK